MSPPRRLTTADFDPDVLRLFDRYVHGSIDRRGFLQGAGRLLGTAGAVAALAALAPRFAAAQQVAPDDARLSTRQVEFDSPQGYGRARAYLAAPAGANAALPAVLVAHENRGLNPHIEDVTRRLALAGYLAFAPDALFPLGGYPGDEDKARESFSTLDQAKVQHDFLAAFDWLAASEQVSGRIGAVGFCWGGGMVNFLATQRPALAAAAPFYGMAPDLAAVPAIRAELLVVLAAKDDRINAAWPAYRAALEAAGVRHAVLQPEGTVHGFNNDTTPRYAEAAAAEAWGRMLALFERTLRRGSVAG